MIKFKFFGVLVLGIAAITCAPAKNAPLIDPFLLRFPLVEAGKLDIEGTIVGQPRARDGIVYFATREGFLTAVVVPARQILWRFKADHTISVSPELSENHVLLRDDGNIVYVVDLRGSLVLKQQLDEGATTAVREDRGKIFFGTANGKIFTLDLPADGAQLGEYTAAASTTAISAGPVFIDELVIFGAADGRLIALDQAGKPAWDFAAKGAIASDPAVAAGRLYLGTEDRFFYCLNAATGKKIWCRRLQGAPLHPALVQGLRLVVPASNSVIYFLSRKGGSILSWEAVPSRVVYELAVAGRLLLVSSASPNVAGFDISTGKPVGQHVAFGTLAAGALWVPPFVVLIDEEVDSGSQKFIFLKAKNGPSSATVEKPGRMP
jgi:outer membrane protein assembly factor BamB